MYDPDHYKDIPHDPVGSFIWKIFAFSISLFCLLIVLSFLTGCTTKDELIHEERVVELQMSAFKQAADGNKTVIKCNEGCEIKIAQPITMPKIQRQKNAYDIADTLINAVTRFGISAAPWAGAASMVDALASEISGDVTTTTNTTTNTTSGDTITDSHNPITTETHETFTENVTTETVTTNTSMTETNETTTIDDSYNDIVNDSSDNSDNSVSNPVPVNP